MAFKIRNTGRVRVTFSSSGASIVIDATVPNFRALNAVLSNGDTFVGAAVKNAEWCAGLLTYNAGVVTQTDIREGSNGANPVNFSSGTGGELFIDAPSDWFDELNLSAITVASAATCDIGAVHGAKIIISGTTTITSLGTTAHKRRFVKFSGALTLTHDATSLILPGGKNKPTAAGDTAVFLSDSSGNWTCWSYTPAAGTVVSVKQQKFTSSGTYTPSAGMVYGIAELVGGGGGGGSAAGTVNMIFGGGGGGGGSYSRLRFDAATIGASKAVTIGAKGAGGASGSNNGAAGGDTSLGSLCIAKGGAGGAFGSAASVGPGGAGGIPGTGDLTAAGMPGGIGYYNGTANNILQPSGMGGSSYFGGGGVSIFAPGTTAAAGTNAGNYGGGGAGAMANNVAANAKGGDGSDGFVIITEYCTQ
jgi:hypothetical protein